MRVLGASDRRQVVALCFMLHNNACSGIKNSRGICLLSHRTKASIRLLMLLCIPPAGFVWSLPGAQVAQEAGEIASTAHPRLHRSGASSRASREVPHGKTSRSVAWIVQLCAAEKGRSSLAACRVCRSTLLALLEPSVWCLATCFR